MKILLFGKNGQVGWELNRSLLPLGEVVALGREDADFSEPESLRQIVQDVSPDVIVNAVAHTAVDKAEEEEGLAIKINGVAAGVLAEEALTLDALLVHYSTDYIFDGNKDGPYLETDTPCPINAYGRSKLKAEELILASGCDALIFRTSWVYGIHGNNFIKTILKLATSKESIQVIDDQFGVPTSARFIADVTAHAIKQALSTGKKFSGAGIYNLTSSGSTNWYEFARMILEILERADPKQGVTLNEIKPVPSEVYQSLASRPKNSVLNVDKLINNFGIDCPDWRVVVSLSLEQLFSSNQHA